MSTTNQFPPQHLVPENDETNRNSQAELSQEDISTASPSHTSDQQSQQLALPSAKASSDPASTEPTQHDSVSADGGDVKHTLTFEHLGPLVVNKDGTLSRIHNWAQMGEAERERTVRVLGKRNMLRKEAILGNDAAEVGMES